MTHVPSQETNQPALDAAHRAVRQTQRDRPGGTRAAQGVRRVRGVLVSAASVRLAPCQPGFFDRVIRTRRGLLWGSHAVSTGFRSGYSYATRVVGDGVASLIRPAPNEHYDDVLPSLLRRYLASEYLRAIPSVSVEPAPSKLLSAEHFLFGFRDWLRVTDHRAELAAILSAHEALDLLECHAAHSARVRSARTPVAAASPDHGVHTLLVPPLLFLQLYPSSWAPNLVRLPIINPLGIPPIIINPKEVPPSSRPANNPDPQLAAAPFRWTPVLLYVHPQTVFCIPHLVVPTRPPTIDPMLIPS